MKITIIGSGIAGCMAANYFKNEDITIIEKNNKVSFNYEHNAIMRMKDVSAGLILGNKLKKIKIEKNYLFNKKLFNKPNILMKNKYSLKVSNKLCNRSIDNFDNSFRYIFADKNNPLERFNVIYGSEIISFNEFDGNIFISTIPLPDILKILKINHDIDFNILKKSIKIIKLKLNINTSNLYQTIYIVDDYYNAYRATLQDGEIIFEFIYKDDCDYFKEMCELLYYFGLKYCDEEYEILDNKNGKIIEIDDEWRKGIIAELTEKYNIYSLGRYAIWKPGLMIDDLVQDLKIISKMINISKKRRKYESIFNQLH